MASSYLKLADREGQSSADAVVVVLNILKRHGHFEQCHLHPSQEVENR